MSISQNFPEEGPTLNLNFAGSKILDPRITFARPSTSGDATYMDANGLIVTAAADEPRFDHRYVNGEIESLGLLVEESRTNFVLNSDTNVEFSNGASPNTWTGGQTAPDGSATAKICTTNYRSFINYSASGTANNPITYSVFLKATSPITRTLDLRQFSSDIILATKTIDITTNWQRFDITSTSATDGCQIEIQGGIQNISAWGAQLEAGAFPTSYIPTDDTSGGKTRSPDNVSMTGTNFSDWYNPTEGTLYVSASILGKNIHTTGVEYPNGICKLSDTGSNPSYSRVLYFGGNVDPDRVSFGNRDSSSNRTMFDNSFGDIQSNQYYKVCGAYINNDEQALCLNGRDIRLDLTNVNPPTPNQFLIGTGYNGGISGAPNQDEMYLNGHISQLTYYPTRLPNSQLQNLTK